MPGLSPLSYLYKHALCACACTHLKSFFFSSIALVTRGQQSCSFLVWVKPWHDESFILFVWILRLLLLLLTVKCNSVCLSKVFYLVSFFFLDLNAFFWSCLHSKILLENGPYTVRHHSSWLVESGFHFYRFDVQEFSLLTWKSFLKAIYRIEFWKRLFFMLCSISKLALVLWEIMKHSLLPVMIGLDDQI